MVQEIEKVNDYLVNNLKEIRSRFKLPIVITYSVVLIIYNWDIIFFLAFENIGALKKIQYVKSNLFTENAGRIWKPILLSILYSILFPTIQVILNVINQRVKKFNNELIRNEEISNAIHAFNVQQQLSGKQNLQQLQNRIDQLLIEKNELLENNKSLISQLKTESEEVIDSKSILNAELDKTAKEIYKNVNKLTNEEKSAFIEVITKLEKKTDSFEFYTIERYTIFPQHAKKVVDLLKQYKIIEQSTHSTTMWITNFGASLITYFKTTYIK